MVPVCKSLLLRRLSVALCKSGGRERVHNKLGSVSYDALLRGSGGHRPGGKQKGHLQLVSALRLPLDK